MLIHATRAVVIATALALLPLPAGADPGTDLDRLTGELTTATTVDQVDHVLAALPPVLSDLREITESQDALHVLANTQAFVSTAGDLPISVVTALLPGLLNLLSALISQYQPQLPLIPLPFPFPLIPLALP
ncbi:hypothetical protein [Actinokineospora globicatena]|uniref:hypothetical protein n=1 Tax=Actinokineospora globicatena TaxID=103729 RepID=UPI0020A50C55|nr:hypothetical protein [Actinokineospora globicatena]MCP2306369.1 hypothetical protein [Actinokineospora globicatena]GLW81796.1 hypothetical protein Aglo01_62770 [Actinokineospora globicatena]GLW88590.1 hypothetical protein Aglo02_62290 [Actinokineospora globicatena]